MCGQVEDLLRRDGIQRARLGRLASASPGWPQPFAWMLDVDVHADAAREPALGPGWGAWLADLRQLGMGPAAMVVIDLCPMAAGTSSEGEVVAGCADGPRIEAPARQTGV